MLLGSRYSRATSFGSLRAALVAVPALAVASACASTHDGAVILDDPVAALQAPTSEGTVEIGQADYEFRVRCHALGAGDVVVVGTGDDPSSGGVVELYLEASLVEPYVGLRLADGTLVEPSLDSPLNLYVQDDVIRASAIRFVRDLDLDTGEATAVGFGELEIHCPNYAQEPPA